MVPYLPIQQDIILHFLISLICSTVGCMDYQLYFSNTSLCISPHCHYISQSHTFSCLGLKILSFFLSFDSLVIMCITGSLFKFILLVLDVYIHVIHQTWEVSSHISSAPFSLISFWDSQNKYACPLGSVHFSLIFFLSAPQTHNFHCLIFNITNAFFCLLKLAFASL